MTGPTARGSLLLERLGWQDGVIDAVVCTDDVPAGRPAPYLVHRAMERTRCARPTSSPSVADLPEVLARLGDEPS
ncbi:hypothetical protein [Promicromonospora iranensis]|jgi:FMN phosphatase YigB (HAD superfamily)|uniref:hypothetical protein n=1 Tax=Promicromonospora iranensis TaxID=1105144 RepID=UPI0023A97415|nr:hypothetical protein [Promicromonospora iranensis]